MLWTAGSDLNTCKGSFEKLPDEGVSTTGGRWISCGRLGLDLEGSHGRQQANRWLTYGKTGVLTSDWQFADSGHNRSWEKDWEIDIELANTYVVMVEIEKEW